MIEGHLELAQTAFFDNLTAPLPRVVLERELTLREPGRRTFAHILWRVLNQILLLVDQVRVQVVIVEATVVLEVIRVALDVNIVGHVDVLLPDQIVDLHIVAVLLLAFILKQIDVVAPDGVILRPVVEQELLFFALVEGVALELGFWRRRQERFVVVLGLALNVVATAVKICTRHWLSIFIFDDHLRLVFDHGAGTAGGSLLAWCASVQLVDADVGFALVED